MWFFYSSRLFVFKLIGPSYCCKLVIDKKCSISGDLQDIFRWSTSCQRAFNSCQISTLSWPDQDIFFQLYVFLGKALLPPFLHFQKRDIVPGSTRHWLAVNPEPFSGLKGSLLSASWTQLPVIRFPFPPAGTGHREAFCPATASSSGQIIQKHNIIY